MKGKKRFIVTMLFFINIIMLVAAVIPHHHHPNGMICMKQDQPVEQQCPNHHHHPASDSCCSSECMTRFHSPIPSVHTDSGPNYVFVATLFTDTTHFILPSKFDCFFLIPASQVSKPPQKGLFTQRLY